MVVEVPHGAGEHGPLANQRRDVVRRRTRVDPQLARQAEVG